MDGKEDIQKKKNPREGVNPLSAIVFTWILKTFWLGYKRDLEEDDLTKPLKEHESSVLGDKISAAWENELKRINAKNNKEKKKNRYKPSLKIVLIKVFGLRLAVYGVFLFFMEMGLCIAQPLALRNLLKYFSSSRLNSEITKADAYLWAGVLLMSSIINIFIFHPCMFGILHIGMKMRIAFCSLVYRKALKLSKTSLGETTIGRAVNLLSNDASRFDTSMIFLHYLWIGPVESIVVTVYMYNEVGVSAIIGVASLLMFIPLQGWLGKRSSVLRLKTAIRTDERVRLTNEIITGIQAIKMYTWENPFSKFIEQARKREISVIRSASYIKGVIMSFSVLIARICLFVTIIAYHYLGTKEDSSNGTITAQKVFMITSYFTILRATMTFFFPQGIAKLAELLVSIERFREFMMYEEMDNEKIENFENKEIYRPFESIFNNLDKKLPVDVVHEKGSITIENGYAKWLPSDSEDALRQITLRVKPGELVAIVGQVGSGKSSLLNVILKELKLNQGSVDVRGNIAYASQEPWLFGGSVRTNILFGKKMDPKRYEKVIKVCQLKRDFQLFPYGDKTIVGERGISMSGGQRARINLARAVYADTPIYLLDDPLSAVDAHVGKNMFKECIEDYLKGKTRILVTHQIQFLRNVEKIIVMKDGGILAVGSYDELSANGVDFGRLMLTPTENNDTVLITAKKKISRQASTLSNSSTITNGTTYENQEEPEEVEEIRTKGNLGGHIYSAYFKAGGNFCVILTIFAFFIWTQLLGSGGDYFIAFWVNLEESFSNSTIIDVADARGLFTTENCVYIFSGITIAMITVTLVRSVLFFAVCTKASKNLHDRMFRCISRATMRFFNTNSSGRVLNRFSKDMGAVDDLLPMAMIDSIQVFLALIGIIVVVSFANPWLMIPTLIIGILFFLLRVVYLSTSMSVKRLEGVTRSPVFSHLSASMQGLATIRSFNAEEVLIKEFDHHQDLHSSAWFFFLATSRAFGLWLDILCMFFIAAVSLSFLTLPEDDDGVINGGNVGLAITQSIALTGMLQWGVRQNAELENQMTSVERVVEYTNLESEPPLESSPDKKPQENWPLNGNIEFRNLNLSYDPLDPPVLKNLNFIINGREKVGIVGRTGAGKSSLISALFRLTNLEGSIIIDEVDTQDIGLHDLRSKISIIPQEPFLFSGTLRKNLDPFESYADSLLWAALEEVELKEMDLHTHINEGGSNLSVGQRQLVCLARAIISNNKILILDEATANVDTRTDELIQKTIRKKFADCTVLTIAHRLNTVMDSDKILVMDAGTVKEFDHPYLLVQNPDGALSSMIKETGHVMAEALIAIVKENYQLRQHLPTTSL